MEYSIREKCHVNTNYDTDTFVGVKCENGDFSVNFPLGFNMSDDDKTLRKDILLLINSLALKSENRDSTVLRNAVNYDNNGFPIQAYMYLIADYYERGIYKEREVAYLRSNRGKIDWNRTIKTQKPSIQDNDAFYLDFIIRRNPINENELITLIHEFCVYVSFVKIGWLYTNAVPAKPRFKFHKKLFLTVIQSKIQRTFNDRNKELFLNMLAIIQSIQDQNVESDFCYGTTKYEYVWEYMIDRVFGIAEKSEYFPSTTWNLKGLKYPNADLEPDTIMIFNDNIFVLDAKYYKFGVTGRPGDLPGSSSINKQITYAEYIVQQERFRKGEKTPTVYNAFLMPYDAFKKGPYEYIGEATGNWKTNQNSFERVQGLLVDIKYLMNLATHNNRDIEELARIIESSLSLQG